MTDGNRRRVILLTGGAGYIGGHTAVQLAATGQYDILIADNLSNTCQESINVIKDLCQPAKVDFVQCDLVNESEKLADLKFDGVIHFAAMKAVAESCEKPLEYYNCNIRSLLNVLFKCREIGCKTFVYSSSATVYQPSENLLTEESPLGASNPYGHTKVIGEQIVKDLAASDPSWKIMSLRYFNPIGAHPSGRMGESPERPQNILPIIQKVAVGKLECVNICGNDWPTRDGTGVRDYIHVMDLADGHVMALDYLEKSNGGVHNVLNLGTGKGVSVLEMIETFSKASKVDVKHRFVGRRPGDLASVVADPTKAKKVLGFETKRTVYEACESAWKWQSTHPDGFKTKQKQ